MGLLLFQPRGDLQNRPELVASADAQFKAGVRYESKYVIAALTYGDGLQGNEGGGFEIGLMVFTIPWT